MMSRRLQMIVANLVLAPLIAWATNGYYFHTVDVRDGMADNFVRDIIRDCHGYTWIATINGLSCYDGHRFKNFFPHQTGDLSNDVTSIDETADSTLWMVCTGGIYTYDRKGGTWQNNGAEKLSALGVEGAIGLVYTDDRRNLWVTTETGVYHYDYSKHTLQHTANYSGARIAHIAARGGRTIILTDDYRVFEVPQGGRRLVPIAKAPDATYSRDCHIYIDSRMNLWLYNSHTLEASVWMLELTTRQWKQPQGLGRSEHNMVNAIAEDHSGRLWIATANAGIHIYEFRGNSLSEVAHMDAFTTKSSHVTCLYPDENNTMWVGSAKLGIAFTDMSSPGFTLVNTNDCEDVSSLIEDDLGNLWIGFDGNGIMVKTVSGNTIQLTAQRRQLPSDIITSLAIDGHGAMLAGTYGNGIVRLHSLHPSPSYTPLYPNYGPLKYVKAMVTDHQGNLWVATVDQGVVRIRPDGKISNYTSENSTLMSNGILCLACDSLNNIYIGTSAGICVFDGKKNDFVTVEPLNKLRGAYVNSLLVFSPTAQRALQVPNFTRIKSSSIWIGTRNGLWIYHPQDGTVSQLTVEQGMSHNTVRALARSNDRIWASTDNGLTCISVGPDNQGKLIYRCDPFFDADGLQGIMFSNDAALTTRDGTALLGSFTGYVSISPDSRVSHYPKLNVQFTDFRINGQNSDSHTLSNFTIRYGERPSIYVSAMMPQLNRKIRYLYRFKGEEDWARAPGSVLYFAGLIPGTHVLQVKAVLGSAVAQNEGQTSLATCTVAELPIKVLPPPWLSNTAIFIYLVLLIAAIVLLYRSMRLRQKREFAIKQLEMNLEKYEIEEDKIRFFTNISHDLKTPLTLVVAPLEKIRAANLPASIRTDLDVAWRNARQLYDLILELLDFRRLDVGKEKLNLRHGDIVGFVRQTAQGFAYYATRKQIKVILKLPPAAVEISFDESKMRRIITNLLSNAFKYNEDNGSVTVSLDIGEELVLSVADTGIGVGDKRRIFDRFVQERSDAAMKQGQEQEGSGLGLHIVRQYVDMMGGTITVTDNKPKGTVFTVTLPVNGPADTDIEELPTEEANTTPDSNEDNDKLSSTNNSGKGGKPVILVVEDNTDARMFLQRSLGDEYRVVTAANGKEALSVLSKTNGVKIIISDVMMPVMDGIELFRHIRSDIRYSHIPVILLTAKSSEESVVAGLQEGAADYITKPFSLAVLQLRIAKILEWSNNAHNKVAAGIEIKPSEITVSSLDEELIRSVTGYIEANIQDQNYTVVQLSSDVGMTRGHLYKKLVAITGKSPQEFIRIVRMKRGKSLIDQGRTNISEVSDMVGVSPKQFAHYFRLMYGDTPSEYLKKQKK